MKPARWIGTALALAALAVGAAAQDDPYSQLKQYDFQNRKALAAIEQRIREAGPDRSATAAVEAGLITVLEDPAATFAGKQAACRLLWIVGTTRSVPALARMLPDEKLNNPARYALERMSDPAAGKALRAALGRTKGGALIGVVNSLGERGDPEAVMPLRKLAVSPDKLVAEAAVTALGKIGTPAALAALEKLPKSPAAYRGMLRSAEKMAASGRRAEAERVLTGLAASGRPAMTRAAAVQALAAMNSPGAVSAAMAGLRSDDPYVQRVAARTLGMMTVPEARPSAAVWSSLSPGTQAVLLTAWADRRDPAATDLAIAVTQSDDPVLRAAAIRAAAWTGGAKAVPRLAEMAAKGPDNGLAREALAGMPGQDAEQALLQAARNGSPEVRAALMGVLADRPNAAGIEVLMDAARGTDPRVASEALRALGRAGGPEQHGELVKVLVGAQDEGVRDAAREAVVAIGQRMGDRDRAAAPLLAAMPEASPAGRCALLPALAEVGGDRALDELKKAAADGDAAVKQAAVAALAETWADARAVPTLLEIAKSDADRSRRVQALRGALRLIGQDGGLSPDDRTARLGEALPLAERPEEKRQALGVLREVRVPAAMELAARLLDDADLFTEAAGTVLYLAAPQKKDDRDLPAVKGPATDAALDKIIQKATDENLKAQAQKLR